VTVKRYNQNLAYKTMIQPLTFDIKRYAINDGPGIRITIFLKGCLLSCDWCHNPESQSAKVQKMYSKSKCIGCGECVEACPENACKLTPEGIITNPEICLLCGKCAKVCPTKATEMSGEEMSVEQIMAAIEKERVFFEQSGGGVTFSGGEPLMFSGFLIKLLDECGSRNIHRVVDTSGFSKKETLLEVAKRTDLFLFDLKMMDDEKHKKYTGISNNQILENLKALAETGADINIRIPLIKGVNDDEENMEQTAAFIAGLSGEKMMINILPYHNIAAGKYEKLGGEYQEKGMAEPNGKRQQKIINIFEDYGLEAAIGG